MSPATTRRVAGGMDSRQKKGGVTPALDFLRYPYLPSLTSRPDCHLP